jgi:arginine kinase
MGKAFTSNIASPPMAECQGTAPGTMMGKHLNDWDDIQGTPYFPAGCKSLLSKCLTPDVWEKCKDRRDKYGFSFR